MVAEDTTPYDKLLEALSDRLYRDLHRAPLDNGRSGWELACKALLWYFLSDGPFSRKTLAKNITLDTVLDAFRKTTLRCGLADPIAVELFLANLVIATESEAQEPLS